MPVGCRRPRPTTGPAGGLLHWCAFRVQQRESGSDSNMPVSIFEGSRDSSIIVQADAQSASDSFLEQVQDVHHVANLLFMLMEVL